MQVCSSHVTSQCYTGYMQAMAEPLVVQAQREEAERCAMWCDITSSDRKFVMLCDRWERRLREAQQRVAGDTADAAVDPHVTHIQENLIQPRCPQCKALVPDFDHCAHLQVRRLPPPAHTSTLSVKLPLHVSHLALSPLHSLPPPPPSLAVRAAAKRFPRRRLRLPLVRLVNPPHPHTHMPHTTLTTFHQPCNPQTSIQVLSRLP